MSGRERFVLDVRGPGRIYVLDSLRSSPKWAAKVAGPFGSEHAALAWITTELAKRANALGKVFDSCVVVLAACSEAGE